jgi:hypothetical protein
MSVYKFAVDNVRAYIRSPENSPEQTRSVPPMNAFDAAQVLAVAFMKPQGDVMADLIAPAN